MDFPHATETGMNGYSQTEVISVQSLKDHDQKSSKILFFNPNA